MGSRVSGPVILLPSCDPGQATSPPRLETFQSVHLPNGHFTPPHFSGLLSSNGVNRKKVDTDTGAAQLISPNFLRNLACAVPAVLSGSDL